MAEVLDEWGIEAALVHGGFSSVLALEAPPGSGGWPLTLSAPGGADAPVLARLRARHLALSASGTRKGDHVVDPRSGEAAAAGPRGRPSRPGRTAAPSAAAEGWPDLERSPSAVAEGLSTAFMIFETAHVEHAVPTGTGRRSLALRGGAARRAGDARPLRPARERPRAGATERGLSLNHVTLASRRIKRG